MTIDTPIPVVHIKLPEYVFDISTNPFAWDAKDKWQLKDHTNPGLIGVLVIN